VHIRVLMPILDLKQCAMWPHHVSQDIKASLLELSNHDKESSTKDSAVNNHAGTTLREDKM
jgi:hypothetical protein